MPRQPPAVTPAFAHGLDALSMVGIDSRQLVAIRAGSLEVTGGG